MLSPSFKNEPVLTMSQPRTLIASNLGELELAVPRIFVASNASINTSACVSDIAVTTFANGTTSFGVGAPSNAFYAEAAVAAGVIQQGFIQVGDEVTIIATGAAASLFNNGNYSQRRNRAYVEKVDASSNKFWFKIPVTAGASTASGSVRCHIPFRRAQVWGMKTDGTANTGIVSLGVINDINYQQIKLAASLGIPAAGNPNGSSIILTADAGAKMELSQWFFKVATANDAAYFLLT